MGLGPIELLIIAALMLWAIKCGRGLSFGAGLLFVLLLFGGWTMLRAERTHVQWHHGPMPEHGNGAELDMHLSTYALLLIALACVVVFSAVRRHGGRGWGGLLALAAVGSLLFMAFGSVVRIRRIEYAPPHAAMVVHPHGPALQGHSEEPIDELWERLNESRIQLSSQAEQATQQAMAAATVSHAAAAATENHKAATAGRAPGVPDAPAGESATTEPADEETTAEEPPADEVADASPHENEEAASHESVDEALDEHVEGSDSETTADPSAHDADFAETTEPADSGEPVDEPSAPAWEQVPPPVEPAAPPVEPAPAAEPFADPYADGWVDESPAAPADSESVAALPAPDLEPKPRPEWVGMPPKSVGNIYRVPVEAGPYVTLKECYEQLRQEMRQVVTQRVEELVRESTGSPYPHVPDLDRMQLGSTFIDELLADDYVEIHDTSVGTMRTAWGLLEFTPNHDRHLVAAWKDYARRDRIAMVTATASLVLAVLAGILLLLKIDTWTRGYYTKRLFLGVPAAIIALLALGVMIAEM